MVIRQLRQKTASSPIMFTTPIDLGALGENILINLINTETSEIETIDLQTYIDQKEAEPTPTTKWVDI